MHVLDCQVLDWQSVFQSKAIPIPRFPPVDESVNFVGRLAREILRVTDPRVTTYVASVSAWFDMRTQKEVLSSKICALVCHSSPNQALVPVCSSVRHSRSCACGRCVMVAAAGQRRDLRALWPGPILCIHYCQGAPKRALIRAPAANSAAGRLELSRERELEMEWRSRWGEEEEGGAEREGVSWGRGGRGGGV